MSTTHDAKVQKLMDQLEDRIGQMSAALTELRAAVSGENPTRDIILEWSRSWKQMYGASYSTTKIDAGNLKRLITEHGAAEISRRLARYLSNRERFIVEKKHPLSLFVRNVNTYATRQTKPAPDTGIPLELEDDLLAPAPADCRHEPPCADDLEHTRRRAQDMRR